MSLYNVHLAGGKSAYQYAVDGGFEGTEAEFVELMGDIGNFDSVVAAMKEEIMAEVGGEWKLQGSVTGFDEITLPSSYSELYITSIWLRDSSTDNNTWLPNTIVNKQIMDAFFNTTNYTTLELFNAFGSNRGAMWEISKTNNTLKCTYYLNGTGTNIVSNGYVETTVYYR